MSLYKWLQRREHGLQPSFGDRDFVLKRVYNSTEAYYHWNDDGESQQSQTEFGAIFNLEFSPEGNVLVAACERKSILLFDPITTKLTKTVPDAHTDCVNCIKFLDDRMFATCSDDTTVALWDLRFLKTKMRSLHGHSNWVKSIEYSHKDHLLVTSGFDGSIFTWDINSYTEQGLIYQKVFHTSGLMRCRIAAEGDKLVICTTGGYLMIIHKLDLTTLHKDLCGFRPSIYRLMQMGRQYIPHAAKFDHVFSKNQKKNRVELVTDFPEENDAEVILSLQIHPNGHSVLSRNISFDELSEWSCLHDINEEPNFLTEMGKDNNLRRKRKLYSGSDDEELPIHPGNEEEIINSSDDVPSPRLTRNQRRRMIEQNSSTIRLPELFAPDIWAAEVTVQERAIRQNRARNANSVTGYNFVYAISSGVLPIAAASRSQNVIRSPNSRQRHNLASSAATSDENRMRESSNLTTSIDENSSTSSSDSLPDSPFGRAIVRSVLIQSNCSKSRQIFQNPKKLMYYIQESNNGKGFIKEPSFSSDGRIICSPFDTGVRLLGFTQDCSEYPYHRVLDNGKKIPRSLVEIKNINSHSDIVLSTKFSPREPLLVTGCRNSKIVFHQPNL